MNKEYKRKAKTKRIPKQTQEDEETRVKKSENRYLTTLFIPKRVKTTLIMTTDLDAPCGSTICQNPVIERCKVPLCTTTFRKRPNELNRGPCYHSYQIIRCHVNMYHIDTEYKETPTQNSKTWSQNNTPTCARPQSTIAKKKNARGVVDVGWSSLLTHWVSYNHIRLVGLIRYVNPLCPIGPY